MAREFLFGISDDVTHALEFRYGDDPELWVAYATGLMVRHHPRLFVMVGRSMPKTVNKLPYCLGSAFGYLAIQSEMQSQGVFLTINSQDIDDFKGVIAASSNDQRWVDDDWRGWAENVLKSGERPALYLDWFRDILKNSPYFYELFQDLMKNIGNAQNQEDFKKGVFFTLLPFHVKTQLGNP